MSGLCVSKSPPQEFSPKAKINFNYFFGGVYVEKVLCGPNSARSPFSKKMRSIFFDMQRGRTACPASFYCAIAGMLS